MASNDDTPGHVLFWQTAAPLLEADGVAKSTMMGFPCLRVNGAYFGSVHKDGSGMIVKLPADRVTAAVAGGEGDNFAPAGKVFKEWLFVPFEKGDTWSDLLNEAYDFIKP